MSGSTLFYIAFAAVVVMLVLLVFVALGFEAGGDPPAPGPEAAEPADDPGEPSETAGASRKSA